MIKPPKTPSQLLRDNDGHWYLVPSPYLAAFEAALSLTDVQYDAALSKFARYGIDGPEKLIIIDWREL